MLFYNQVGSTVYIAFSLTCFLLLLLLYIKRRMDTVVETRHTYIDVMFITTAALIFTDSAWCALELSDMSLPGLDFALIAVGYVIFLCSAYGWMLLGLRRTEYPLNMKVLHIAADVPFAVVLVLMLLSWSNGWIIDITDEGLYDRGPCFFIPFILGILYYGTAAIALLVKARSVSDRMSRRFFVSLAIIPLTVIVTILLQVGYAFNFCFLGMLLSLCVYDNEQMLALWRRTEEEKARSDEHLQVISGLTSDFECVTYIRLGRSREEDEMVPYCPNKTFSRCIPNWDTEQSYRERLNLIRKHLVTPGDKDRFYAETRRETIIRKVLTSPAYYVNFNCLVDGCNVPYQLKYIGVNDEDENLIALIAGIHRV